jgi:hypothetical protein
MLNEPIVISILALTDVLANAQNRLQFVAFVANAKYFRNGGLRLLNQRNRCFLHRAIQITHIRLHNGFELPNLFSSTEGFDCDIHFQISFR